MSKRTLPTHTSLRDPVLLVDAVAEGRFGAYSTLRKRISEGRVAAEKSRGRVFVERADLEKLCEPTPVVPREAAGDALDADTRAWAERIASSAPPLSPSAASAVAAILRGAAA